MAEPTQFEKLVEEVRLFLTYGVPPEDRERALALVGKYRYRRRALQLLRQYYMDLPDAREEAAIGLSLLLQRQGIALMVLSTTSTAHLYAVSAEEAVWLGEYRQELDAELLAFWGYARWEDFLAICKPVAELGEYLGEDRRTSPECPACGVGEGEVHFFGCVVEVCPWCGGQLSRCNCRFEQLQRDSIDDEEQVDKFLRILEEKGRIPFSREQAPAYPGTGEGFDKGRP